MRSSRLLALLMQLQLRGRVSAPELAQRFEVSIRTIYRDVDELSASGVPVYAERGRLGGIVLRPGYRTELTGLTPNEARSLPLLGLAMAANDLGLGAEAGAAQHKLLAALPGTAGADAQHIAERFHLDPVPWYHRAEHLPLLPELARALWQDRQVKLRYEGWASTGERLVSPLGLVLKGGLWYLVARAGKGVGTYRVSAIQSLQVLPEAVLRPPGFHLAQHWPASVARFEARLMPGLAEVRLSPEGLRILRAEHPAAAERALASARPARRKGWLRTQLPVQAPHYSARQFLRLGTEVEVIGPAAVRRALAQEAAAVAQLYAPAGPPRHA